MSVSLPQTLLESTAWMPPICQDIAEFKAKLKAEIWGGPWIMSSWVAVATFRWFDEIQWDRFRLLGYPGKFVGESYQSEDNFNFYNFYIWEADLQAEERRG